MKAKPLYGTDENYRPPLSSYLLEGAVAAFILIMASVCGCMTANHVMGVMSAKCFCPVEKDAR
jgi:hypothetical protein